MTFIRLSFLWPLQYFSTNFLLVANLFRSTIGIFRSALKYPLIHAAN